MKETIQNSELWLGPRCWENYQPHFSHIEIEHGPPLDSSDNRIINNLLKSGFSINETVNSFFFGFPTRAYTLTGHFIAKQKREYRIHLGDDGFLSMRFQDQNTIWLSLFYIFPTRQQQGRGRYWFPKVCDALFQAGAFMLIGRVSPSHYPTRLPMDQNRLMQFYIRHGFSASRDGQIWKLNPYRDGLNRPGDSPNSQETGTRKASQIATIS